MRHTVLAFLMLVAGACHAGVDRSQLARLHAAIDELVRQQTAGLPGKVSFVLGAIDERLSLPPCAAPEAFVPPGVRLWGNANVGVRCTTGTPWTIYVAVTIRVSAGVVTAARALAQGHAIEASDIVVQEADLAQLPGAVVTEPRMAIGRIPVHSVAPGQPLRQDLLRSPPVVQMGQSVTLVSRGAGFKVSAEGKALGNAAEGQVAQVRTPSGRTVSGIARSGGVVEVQ